MNNYSWLQKKLHFLALSNKLIRTATYDIEDLFNKNVRNSLDNHVFILGLARSGSTILLNSIHSSNDFASLSYDDMPFILAPNLWSRLTPNKTHSKFKERAHGDGIKISTISPEAFEEIFWQTFVDKNYETYIKFKRFISLVLHKYKKKRYLSKNNQNIKRIAIIQKIFPKSKIFIVFRNPVDQAKSLLNQHKRFFIKSKNDSFVSDYMKWTYHQEFGKNYLPIISERLKYKNDFDINHWLEQWHLVYRNCFNEFKNNANVKFVCYEKLCNYKSYFKKILNNLNIKNKYDFYFKQSHQKSKVDFDDGLKLESMNIYEKMYDIKL